MQSCKYIEKWHSNMGFQYLEYLMKRIIKVVKYLWNLPPLISLSLFSFYTLTLLVLPRISTLLVVGPAIQNRPRQAKNWRTKISTPPTRVRDFYKISFTLINSLHFPIYRHGRWSLFLLMSHPSLRPDLQRDLQKKTKTSRFYFKYCNIFRVPW